MQSARLGDPSCTRSAQNSRPNAPVQLSLHSIRAGCNGLSHTSLLSRSQQQWRRSRRTGISAQAGKGAPPDIPKDKGPERRGGREWLQTLLSRFGPITQKPQNKFILDFEKPLVELDNRIKEVTSDSARMFQLEKNS